MKSHECKFLDYISTLSNSSLNKKSLTSCS
nr:MAG TPA: hypothetical protein [Caudoviricetes sp.]